MTYRCVVADPPWKYGDKLQEGKGAEAHYKTVMTTDEICNLGEYWLTTKPLDAGLRIMGRRIAPDAVLGLWVTNPFLLNGDGMRVCKAWGFQPSQLFTWVKGDLREDALVGPLGMGRIYRVDTEHLILAKRGRVDVLRHDLRNYTFLSPKGRHSAKPDEVYVGLETLVPGPYLELFARRPRDGWDVVGDELPVDEAPRT